MKKQFLFNHPVKIHFGRGLVDKLETILCQYGFDRWVIICDPFFKDKAMEMEKSEKRIKAVFSHIQPNPQLSDIKKGVEVVRDNNADVVIGMGGGSAMDSAKFVAAAKYCGLNLEKYFNGKKKFPTKRIPMIAVPTTAGTGSEVTQVAVINNEGDKRTINNPVFLPFACIVDSSLTLSVPPKATMITGLDALSHALEGYWSVNNQPITDLYAKESVKIIFENLEKAYDVGQDVKVRDNMSYAALLAGLAFAQTKTAGVHACSYPLSMDYHLPHGEACAFTLDKFIEINCDKRLIELAKYAGFKSCKEMAEKVSLLKKKATLKTTLSDCGIDDLDDLTNKCLKHPLMQNNPGNICYDVIKNMFEEMR